MKTAETDVNVKEKDLDLLQDFGDIYIFSSILSLYSTLLFISPIELSSENESRYSEILVLAD